MLLQSARYCIVYVAIAGGISSGTVKNHAITPAHFLKKTNVVSTDANLELFQ